MLRLLIVAILVAGLSPAAQTYILGPDDQLMVRALDVAEFPDTPLRIDANGEINLPTIGRVEAGGKTIEQVEAEVALRLKRYLVDPQVTVSIAEFRSRPVSIFGSITRSGVVQLQGPKTLWELISESGGLKNDAGQSIKITRQLWGAVLGPFGSPSTGRWLLRRLNLPSHQTGFSLGVYSRRRFQW